MPDALVVVEVPSLMTVFAKPPRDDWPLMRAARGEKVADEELVYRLPDGTEMTFRVSSAPVYDPDGAIVAAVAIGRDITEQKHADSASLEHGL